ncbi:peptide-methionine (S)-S-oxide reductase MsrA [Azospirillum sp. ST 5-10]|uniref:peptide-methionine (S)-S-oxide reductase MsrA n=1 Tax=unclassified Azospirillum TaxID=2630922 RepID=UPI003F4A035F
MLALVLLAGPAVAQERTAEAVFAGGCFWCMEPPFDKMAGVLSTTSGYTGGTVADPSYKQVSAGGTGHQEAVRVRYDPDKVSYAALLEVYWRNVDPFDADGQFCDRGDQYRAVIFPETPEQRRLAEESRRAVAERFGRPVATTVEPARPFYPAEAYHQNYYHTNPLQYRFYRFTCGRDRRLDEVWGTPQAAAPLLPGDETATVR